MKETILNFLGVVIVLAITIYIGMSIYARGSRDMQGSEFQVEEPPQFTVYSPTDSAKKFRLSYLNNKATFGVGEGFCFATSSMTVVFPGDYTFLLEAPDGSSDELELANHAEYCVDGIQEPGEYRYTMKYKGSDEVDYKLNHHQIVNVTIE